MQLSTNECLLTDILDCGYADLSMLDGLYNTIGDEIYNGDRSDLLRQAVGNGGLNGILYEFYTDVTLAVKDKIEDLLEEYEEADDKEITELVEELQSIFYDTDDKFIPLTDEELELIKEKVEDLNNVNPYCNCLDSSFQNDLDQTFDDDESVLTNAVDLIKYWLDR